MRQQTSIILSLLKVGDCDVWKAEVNSKSAPRNTQKFIYYVTRYNYTNSPKSTVKSVENMRRSIRIMNVVKSAIASKKQIKTPFLGPHI